MTVAQFDSFTDSFIPLVSQGDYGFLGNFIPIVLVVGLSWFFAKKVRDALFIQFPLVLCIKVFFPFFHTSILFISLALFIMNLLGSSGDLLADVKEFPQKIRDHLSQRSDMIKQATRAIDKDMSADAYSKLKQNLEKVYGRR